MRSPDWIIDGLQASDSLAMSYGPSGVGKSFHVLDKALCISTGKSFHGRKVKRGPVIYIAGEGLAGIQRRIAAWSAHHAIDIDDHDFFVSALPVAFLNYGAVSELLDLIEELPIKPTYIAIDTLNRNFGPGDENSTKDMSAFIDAIVTVRTKTGACVEVVHHTGKTETTLARGSSALRAALDTEISIKRAGNGFSITCTKQKEAEPFTELVFDMVKQTIVDERRNTSSSLVCRADHTPTVSKSGKPLGGCQRAGIRLLQQLATETRHVEPMIDRIVLDKDRIRTTLQDPALCPDGKGYSKSSAYDFISFAVREGLAQDLGQSDIQLVPGLWLDNSET